MIDVSLLPAGDYGTPIDEDDNELFVDQSDQLSHQEDAKLFQTPSEALSQPTPGEIAAPSTSTNSFGFPQPPSMPVGAAQTNPFSKIPPSDATTKPIFTTNSLFSSSTKTSAPTPSWPSFSQTPVSTPAQPQSIIADNTSKPLFSWPTTTQSSPANPVPLTTTAPVEPPKPVFSCPPASQSSSSIFKTSEPLTTTEESESQSALPTSSVASSLFSTQKPAKEFSTSAETVKPLFSWSASNSQGSSTAFNAPDLSTTTIESKPSPASGSSLFSFQPSNLKPSSPTASDAASKSIFSQQTSPATFGAPAPTVSNSLFSKQTEQTITPLETENVTAEPQTTPQPLFSSSPSTNLITHDNQGSTSVKSAVEPEQDRLAVDYSHAESQLPSTEPLSRSESSVGDSVDYRQSWIETLRQSAIDSRNSYVNRKRPLEAEKEEIPLVHEKAKAPSDKPKIRREKVVKSKSMVAPKKQKKASLALASVAPLPTLPILEKVKKLTEAKRPAEDETVSSRTSQIDEDEMLLSAARIAAEQLKSGPRLLQKAPNYSSYMDPFRSSSFLSRSVNSESRVSSSSSSPYARINGYDLALAPETPLGLGRTLSRTEQRLRLTGGKGLAYKPLPHTPEKETSNKKTGKRKLNFNSDP